MSSRIAARSVTRWPGANPVRCIYIASSLKAGTGPNVMPGDALLVMACYPSAGESPTFYGNLSSFSLEGMAPLIPDQFITFFAASLPADGALIGLLFVAITIEPEQVFGGKDQERELAASGAFTSLVNAFMISLIALVPDINIGWGVIFIAGFSLLNVIIHTADKLRRGQRTFSRSLFYTISALLLYGLEIYYSIQLIQQPRKSLDALYSLIVVLIVTYAVALTRAWTLLGGENHSLTRILVDGIKGRYSRTPTTAPNKPNKPNKPNEKSIPPV